MNRPYGKSELASRTFTIFLTLLTSKTSILSRTYDKKISKNFRNLKIFSVRSHVPVIFVNNKVFDVDIKAFGSDIGAC
nr:hypothetical protein TnSNPV_146 [Trichoplusia ni single nucleopolyhedrovirus]